MKRQDILLATLAATKRPFSPVHLQKSLFLVSDKLPVLFSERERYDFQPYDYGPFDSAVYSDADRLAVLGMLTVNRDPNELYRTYSLTPEGRERGQAALAQMPLAASTMVTKIAGLVTGMTFRELVSAIYKSYPRMKEKSVFKE